jgi:hypothetical protein
MWITTVTYSAEQAQFESVESVTDGILAINSIRDQLAAVDGNGEPVPGFEPPSSVVSGNFQSTTVKRYWNTETAAQDFVNFLSQFSWATASYEQN